MSSNLEMLSSINPLSEFNNIRQLNDAVQQMSDNPEFINFDDFEHQLQGQNLGSPVSFSANDNDVSRNISRPTNIGQSKVRFLILK